MSTNVKVVNLAGSVTLPAVGELATILREQIDAMPLVLANLSKADEIDLAGIQLIYSARRYAVAQGKEFHLTGSVPEGVAARFFHCGFVDQIFRDGKELDANLHEIDDPTDESAELSDD